MLLLYFLVGTPSFSSSIHALFQDSQVEQSQAPQQGGIFGGPAGGLAADRLGSLWLHDFA